MEPPHSIWSQMKPLLHFCCIMGATISISATLWNPVISSWSVNALQSNTGTWLMFKTFLKVCFRVAARRHDEFWEQHQVSVGDERRTARGSPLHIRNVDSVSRDQTTRYQPKKRSDPTEPRASRTPCYVVYCIMEEDNWSDVRDTSQIITITKNISPFPLSATISVTCRLILTSAAASQFC